MFDLKRTRELLSLGAKFQGLQVVLLIRDQGLAIAIAAIGGFEALGVWNIVYRFTTVVIILMESLWRSRSLRCLDSVRPERIRCRSWSGRPAWRQW